jgi:hypothetical protein
MQPVLRLQGWQVSDAADGCFRECGGFAFLKNRGDFGTGWTRFLGQSEGLAPLVESTGNKSMKGAGAGMPRAQGFHYVCSDSYRRQAVPGLSG